MLHLRSVEIPQLPERAEFPFTLPLIQNWQPLEFTTPVTFFVGENGSGKSTVMEALAVAAQMITVGSMEAHRDKTLADVQDLARFIKLVWNKRIRKGFFLRAEDFFGWIKSQERMRAEMQDDLKEIDEEFEGRSEYARGLARGAVSGQLAGMQRRYGDGLQKRSHGESFLDLFQARFVPGGLYLLDEPEVPLSPLRQLSLLSLLKQMVEEQEAQFIIATHSPILMAYPGAQILSFDETPVAPVDYADLQHVNLTRDFLSDPESFLRHL
jgi:predicted ATPase